LREFRNERTRETVIQGLMSRDWWDGNNSLVVSGETYLAKIVKEIYPEALSLTVTLNDGTSTPLKTVLYYDGKYYDIEGYVKLVYRLDREALKRREYKRWTKEGVTGAQRIVRQVAKKVVEDLKTGKLEEWADSWIINERSPLIA